MRAYRKIDDHFEVKIEKGRLVVLGVGAGLTFLLVFLVGVLVGKGLWGARPEATLAASAEAPVQEPQKQQYTFYDDLKRPDPTVPQAMTPAPGPQETVGETAVPGPRAAETAPVAPEAPPEPAASAVAKPKPAEPEKRPEPGAASPAKPAEEAKAPKPVKPPEAKPAEQKPAVPPAKTADAAKPAAEAKLGAPSYTVQVGSFRDRASAEDQAKKIADQGVSAQVVLAPMEGRTWFRVQVGRYATRAEAESYYQKKMRPKGIQGFVTQK